MNHWLVSRSGLKIPQTHRYGVADTSAVLIDGVSTALLDATAPCLGGPEEF